MTGENDHVPIAVLDIETTGLQAGWDYIVEVGIAILNPQDGTIRKFLDTPVREDWRPRGHIMGTEWPFVNSTLTPQEVLLGMPWAEAARKIQEATVNFPVTAFNRDFDFGFLESRNIRIYHLLRDLMKWAMDYVQIPHEYYGIKWPSVMEAWDYFYPGVPYTEQHRAYDDAWHEARILWALLEKGK